MRLKFAMIGSPIVGLSVEIGGEGRDSNPTDVMTYRGRRTGHCLSHQRPLHCYHKLVVNSSTRDTPAANQSRTFVTCAKEGFDRVLRPVLSHFNEPATHRLIRANSTNWAFDSEAS